MSMKVANLKRHLDVLASKVAEFGGTPPVRLLFFGHDGENLNAPGIDATDFTNTISFLSIPRGQYLATAIVPEDGSTPEHEVPLPYYPQIAIDPVTNLPTPTGLMLPPLMDAPVFEEITIPADESTPAISISSTLNGESPLTEQERTKINAARYSQSRQELTGEAAIVRDKIDGLLDGITAGTLAKTREELGETHQRIEIPYVQPNPEDFMKKKFNRVQFTHDRERELIAAGWGSYQAKMQAAREAAETMRKEHRS